MDIWFNFFRHLSILCNHSEILFKNYDHRVKPQEDAYRNGGGLDLAGSMANNDPFSHTIYMSIFYREIQKFILMVII